MWQAALKSSILHTKYHGVQHSHFVTLGTDALCCAPTLWPTLPPHACSLKAALANLCADQEAQWRQLSADTDAAEMRLNNAQHLVKHLNISAQRD